MEQMSLKIRSGIEPAKESSNGYVVELRVRLRFGNAQRYAL
jgi:hypothetical protein